MKFVVSKDNISKSLRLISGAVDRKYTGDPILSNVLLNLKNDKLLLTTTDLEVELEHEMFVNNVEEEGNVTIPFKKMADICRVISDKDALAFSTENNKILIRSGKSKFVISSLSAENFPKIEGLKNNFSLKISQKKLRELLEKTSFAIAEQDVRYYLNGLLLHITKEKISAVATDGHRLAISTLKNDFDVEETKVLVPRKGVLEILRILKSDEDEEIEVLFSDTHLCVITKDITMKTMLLEGKFPEYERIISLLGENKAVGTRALLKEAFQRAAALLTEKFKGVRLKLANEVMTVSATNSEKDEVEEELNVNYVGEDLEIGFNVKYLLDFINVIKTDKLKFLFTGPEESVTLQGVGEEETIYVIMPMKI